MTDRATDARLALCDPEAVPRFRAALGRAIAYGTDAYIERDPWRTAEQQAEKVRLNLSERMDSAHCHTRHDPSRCPVHRIGQSDVVDTGKAATAQGIDGVHQPISPGRSTCACVVPASRAIHLISRQHFYFTQAPDLLAKFAARIGAAALKEGLIAGVLYGPRSKDHEKLMHWRDVVYPELRLAMLDERWAEAELTFQHGQNLGACWDPLHIEWRPA